MPEREYPRWVHHPGYAEPSRIVHTEEEEQRVLAKWSGEDESGDIDDLRRQAEALAVKVDGRWSRKRLQEAIKEKSNG